MLKKAKGDESVPSPSIYKLFCQPVEKNVVFIFREDHMETIARRLGYDLSKSQQIVSHRYFPPPKEGLPGLAGPAIGAPLAAMLLEALIALGAEKIMGFGWCGSLVENLAVGDIFVPVTAVSEEGTSRHYIADQSTFSAGEDLRKNIEKHLLDHSQDYRFGPIWTTDAVFRETADKVVAFGEQGVMAVDMETSALCAIAQYRKVQYAAMMIVSDELASLQWTPGFSQPKLESAQNTIMDLIGTLAF
jgi:uridine phosphorylase